MIDYSKLQKNMRISVDADRSCYTFLDVYFIEQDEETITVEVFVLAKEVVIPKRNIVELQIKYPKG